MNLEKMIEAAKQSDVDRQIKEAEAEGLVWYMQYGRVRIRVTEGDDYDYYRK